MARTNRQSVVRGVVAGIAAAGLLIVGMAPTVLAAQHAVKIVGFAFVPSSVTVTVGDTVEWVNGDAVSHTATADDGSWNTGTIAAGTKASQAFPAAGTFAYHCTIHATMTATVVVEAASVPATDAVASTTASSTTDGRPFLIVAAAAIGLGVANRRFRGVRPGKSGS